MTGVPPGPDGRDGSSALGLPRVGTMFAGYALDAVLGRGGMSVVFRAENARLGNKVAIKVLSPELSEDDAFRERFVRESRVAASINHPNIIPISDAGDVDGVLYIVMRYIDGYDLKALLRRERALTVVRACSIVNQVARALQAAHQRGLIHRDVKPGNILIERIDGESPVEHAYLADFGLTKHAQSRSGLTHTGQFVGTVDYVAPEQIQGRPVDSRADLYALGCVLYECVTGVAPFRRESDVAVLWAHVQDSCPPPSSVRSDLPAGFDQVVARAMAKSPADRYQTAIDLVRDLNQLGSDAYGSTVGSLAPADPVPQPVPIPSAAGGGPPVTTPPSDTAGSARPQEDPIAAMPDRSRRSVLSVVAAVAAVAVLAGAGLFALSRSSSNHAAGASSASRSGSTSAGTTAGMPMGGTGSAALLTSYVQPRVWKAYHCQRQMPPVPIAISNASAPTAGLLDSATCRFARDHIAVTLDLFKTDADSGAGWRALLAPTQLVPSRTSSCNRDNLKNAGVWRHMDMKGAKEGGLKFCDLSASGSGYIVWTVKSEATANPTTLPHSLLLSAYEAQGRPRTMLDWWHNCRHQLGEGTGGMVNMPTCPT